MAPKVARARSFDDSSYDKGAPVQRVMPHVSEHMHADSSSPLTVRDAETADIPVLTAIKGASTEALHRDRLEDAQRSDIRYLILVVNHTVVGFACLVLHRPASWSDADDTQHLPQIVDLQVQEAQRGQGYGSAFVRAIERIAATEGYAHLYLSVDPLVNPHAYALYQRLGYQQIQAVPYRKTWAFTDSEGQVHRGEDWLVDMVKQVQG
jgi:GNAT superfamily N-acetyltransferase